MGPRAGMARCGKSHPHRDSIPGPSNLQPVAIPTELPGPHFPIVNNVKVLTSSCGRYICLILAKFRVFRQTSGLKSQIIRSDKNSYIGRHSDEYGQTDIQMDGQT